MNLIFDLSDAMRILQMQLFYYVASFVIDWISFSNFPVLGFKVIHIHRYYFMLVWGFQFFACRNIKKYFLTQDKHIKIFCFLKLTGK